MGLVAWAVLFPAHAQTAANEEAVELEPFRVTAEAVPEATALLTIGRQELALRDNEAAAAGSLGALLDATPGVRSSAYAPGAGRPVIRGFAGYRVGIYAGGLGTGDLSAGSPDHAVAIEPLFIGGVTVLKGQAAVLFGGDAIGGAVVIAPGWLPSMETPDDGGVLGTYGRSVDDGHTAWATHGWRAGTWAGRVGFVARDSDDYRIPGFARTAVYDAANRIRLPPEVQGSVAPNPDGRVPNTGVATRVGAFSLAYGRAGRFVRGGFQRFASSYGVPADGHVHGNPFGEPVTGAPGPDDVVRIDVLQARWFGHARWEPEAAWLDGLDLRVAWTDYAQDEREGPFLANAFAQETTGLRLTGWRRATAWTLFSGLTLDHGRYHNRNLSYLAGRVDEDRLATRSTRTGAFALGAWEPHDALTLTLGARLDHQTARRTDRDNVQRTHTAPVAMAGATWRFGDHWSASLATQYAARPPHADELFIEAPRGAIGIFTLPDPDLDNETSTGLELRLARTGERFQLTLDAFWRRFDGYVTLTNAGFEVDGLTAHAHTARAADFYGGELALTWAALRTGGARVDVRAFADAMRGTDRDRDEPLPRMPAPRLGLVVEARRGAWNFDAEILHTLRQDEVPRTVFGTLRYQSPSAAYTLVGLRLARTWELRPIPAANPLILEGELAIDNLLDAEARPHTSFLKDVAPLPGRSIRAGLKLRW